MNIQNYFAQIPTSTFRSLAVLTMALLCSVVNSRAAVVSFSFSGYISSTRNDGGGLPAGITNNTPFCGIFTYDTTLHAPLSGTPIPGLRTYYFTNTTGYSMWVKVGDHVITSATPKVGRSQLNIGIKSDYGTTDEFSTDCSLENFRLNGEAFPTNYSGGVNFYLTDATKEVFSTNSLPETMPPLDAFTTKRSLGLVVTQNGAYHHGFTGRVTNLTEVVRPQLSIKSLSPGKAELSWPRAARGFEVEYRDQAADGEWQSLGAAIDQSDAAYSTVVEIADQHRYYRLVK
jgi:hypothetical protein